MSWTVIINLIFEIIFKVNKGAIIKIKIKKQIYVLLILISSFLNTQCKNSNDTINPDVYKEILKRSVGISEELNHTIKGSGVFIAKNKIVTCNHILNSLSSPPLVKTFQAGDKLLKVKNKVIENLLDLALLEIDFESESYHSIESDTSLTVGDKVFTIANPYGLEASLLYGSISSLDTMGKDIQFPLLNFIQVQNISYPGVSGAGVFTLEGKIIGINRAAYGFSANTGIGFVIPWDYVKLFLNNN